MSKCKFYKQGGSVMNMKKKIASAALALSVAVGAGATVAAANVWQTEAVPGSNVVVSGCVVRFSEGVGNPILHANAAHQCAGVESVKVDRHGNLVMYQTVDDPARWPILYASCQGDERVGAEYGVICGMSGGTEDTTITLYDTRINRKLNLNNAGDWDRIQHQFSNLWVGWIHAVN